MVGIPSFRASLLNNQQSNIKQSPSVEEIMAQPSEIQTNIQPQRTDYQQKKSYAGRLAVTLIGLGGVFLAGRQGVFGSGIRKMLGGALSTKKLNQKIEEQLQKYVERTGGQNFDIKTLANGNIVAERAATLNGDKEIIKFNRKTGAPELRVVFTNNRVFGGKSDYVTYKGSDILDEGFDSASQWAKKHSADGAQNWNILVGENKNIMRAKADRISYNELGKDDFIHVKYNLVNGKIYSVNIPAAIEEKIMSQLASYSGNTPVTLSVAGNGKRIKASMLDVDNGIQKDIFFNKKTGIPEAKILTERGKNGEMLNRKMYYGEDIITSNNLEPVREFSTTGIKHKWHIGKFGFGPKQEVVVVKNIDDEPVEILRKYTKNGNLKKVETNKTEHPSAIQLQEQPETPVEILPALEV